MYLKRTCEKAIESMCNSFPCAVIYGLRQVGKSTTVEYLFGEKIRKVTLDDIEVRSIAESNPRLFLESFDWPLVIDEIQKVPVLLDEIKIRIDTQRLKWLKKDEPEKLMYILTGSNRFELQQGISESLAGRCGIIEMNSSTQAEKMPGKNRCLIPLWKELKSWENRKYPIKPDQRYLMKFFRAVCLLSVPERCPETATINRMSTPT